MLEEKFYCKRIQWVRICMRKLGWCIGATVVTSLRWSINHFQGRSEKNTRISMVSNSVTHLRSYTTPQSPIQPETRCRYYQKLNESTDIATPSADVTALSADVAVSSADIVALNSECLSVS